MNSTEQDRSCVMVYARSLSSTALSVRPSAPSRTSRTCKLISNSSERAVQRHRPTLATSAVCWKYESEDACSVMRSVGHPDGALLLSASDSTAKRGVNVPVDQQ